MKKLYLVAIFLLSACGTANNSTGSVNVNFPDVSNTAIQTSSSTSPNTSNVVTVNPSTNENASGSIGTIADQNSTNTLCVIIDPAAGSDADLKVCEAESVDPEITDANKVCPDVASSTTITSHCSSRKTGSGPDFCDVTGATDYVFVIINSEIAPVKAVYEVVNGPCGSITEGTILADDN